MELEIGKINNWQAMVCACLVQLLLCLEAFLLSRIWWKAVSHMFGSASQKQFSSLQAILVEATIPSFWVN